MSTIKSDSEDLTLNAHGSGNDILFQSNGSQVGSLTAEGVMTATSFAGSGASLTALNATQLTSGTVPTARLGSGSASSSVFLSGANTWISAADSTKLPLAGGTMTGNLTMGANEIILADDGKIQLGTVPDMEIFHDGSHSYITDGGTGNLKITATQLDILGTSETMATFIDDGAVTLYHNDAAKIATTATGTSVTGNVIATGTVEPAGDTAAGDNAAIGYTAAEGLILTGQGSTNDITIKNDADANHKAMNKVKEDKEREAQAGHDGTWVAHPGLSPIALEAFNSVMPEPNQLHNLREDVTISADDLLQVPSGTITENGVRTNIRVGIQYVEAWLCGNGCVPLYHLMEDAATAEISRAQLWQWIKHEATINDGYPITNEHFKLWLKEELDGIQSEVGIDRFEQGKFKEASQLFSEMITKNEFDEFLTIPAYQYI